MSTGSFSRWGSNHLRWRRDYDREFERRRWCHLRDLQRCRWCFGPDRAAGVREGCRLLHVSSIRSLDPPTAQKGTWDMPVRCSASRPKAIVFRSQK